MIEILKFKTVLKNIVKKDKYIGRSELLSRLNRVKETLSFKEYKHREKNSAGEPGGIIELRRDLPTIIVPDLHARDYFIINLLNYLIDGKTVLELLFLSKIQIVCVGDGFHGERRSKARWLLAAEEYNNGFNEHSNIDMEMRESLTLMSLIMELKIKFPELFHFLKGNHENILNEDLDGNCSFGKFTSEGNIVRQWVEKFYGEDFLYYYSSFEKSLPLFAIGRNFLISHAEPLKAYTKEELVNCYLDTDVIFGLTWTRNGQSEAGSVEALLKQFIDKKYINEAYYFVGHTSIRANYILGLDNKLVQFHNPDKCQIAHIKIDKEINLDDDIGEIDG